MVILKSLKFNAKPSIRTPCSVEIKDGSFPFKLLFDHFLEISDFGQYYFIQYDDGHLPRGIGFYVDRNDELNQKNANYLFHFQYLMKLERGKSY